MKILIKSLNDKVDKMAIEIVNLQGQNKGIREGWGWAVGIFGIIIAVITVVIRLLK